MLSSPREAPKSRAASSPHVSIETVSKYDYALLMHSCTMEQCAGGLCQHVPARRGLPSDQAPVYA